MITWPSKHNPTFGRRIMPAVIYKLTNKINSKVYVGFTTNLTQRLYHHKENSKHKNSHLYSAIRNYGWENFQMDILYESWDIEHCLKIMEPYFIKKYNSTDGRFGYNRTVGGEGSNGWKHTVHTKEKLSSKMKGRKLSDNHKKKIIGYLVPGGHKNHNHSENTKKLMSRIHQNQSLITRKRISDKMKLIWQDRKSLSRT